VLINEKEEELCQWIGRKEGIVFIGKEPFHSDPISSAELMFFLVMLEV